MNYKTTTKRHHLADHTNFAVTNKKVCIQQNSSSSSITSKQASKIDFAKITLNMIPFSLQNRVKFEIVQNIITANIVAAEEGNKNVTVNAQAAVVTNNVLDFIDPDLYNSLKEHQLDAIKFFIDRVINETAEGRGAMLAHNMGLVHGSTKDEIFNDIHEWYKNKKSILIIGYKMYATLVKEGDDFKKFLQNPGPDLVVFDEAHRLKNMETQIFQLAKDIKTPRKILLTDSPLQNNLMELFSLLHLISPKLLGLKEIFKADFVDPIAKGGAKDASAADVKTMQIRSEVLHNRTKDFIHRKSVKVLINAINVPKIEATFMLRPIKIQKKLIEAYLNRVDPDTGKPAKRNPLNDYRAILKILCHPFLFYEYAKDDQNFTGGSLGTNLIGANRVVIFDACWNPTHDIQSLYRVYRLGQTKPVYIYRLVTSGTMEENVYNLQINKEATCHRVVDEENIDRHFTMAQSDDIYRPNNVPTNEVPIIKGNFNDFFVEKLAKKYKKAIVEVIPHESFFKKYHA
uniref:Helicase ATP-binding domain-containing protein n=1 Tax=Panagrolaimus sp. ES5 TaxID=591445 RepID=A0AC34GR07_9BILA